MGLIPLSKSFKMREAFTIEQVEEAIKSQTDLHVEPYFEQFLGNTFMYIPAKGENDIQIQIRKDKMYIAEAPRPKNKVENLGLYFLTDGWSSFISAAKNDNKTLFEQILAACKRLFG
ncbi:MAG: hypothetical protein EOM66_05360 [Clostridia bacterium]|nr:hypothetical protein [Candidatus Pelethousia sp.]NCB30819.1 hypothetical protein [Clostridia bacterium]